MKFDGVTPTLNDPPEFLDARPGKHILEEQKPKPVSFHFPGCMWSYEKPCECDKETT